MIANDSGGRPSPRLFIRNAILLTDTVSEHTSRPCPPERLAKIKSYRADRRVPRHHEESSDSSAQAFTEKNKLNGE